MRIDGENISNEELCELVEIIKPHADKMADKPTEFELITALAFLYFARHKCDVVVLECGLGGRLDATNVIKSPILSVITGISLDHTAILGDTVELIAAEKAGIIKHDTPVLWCGSDRSAESVIRKKAEELGAPFEVVCRESLKVRKMTLEGTEFDFGAREGITLSLLGTYQPENAANVLSAIDILIKKGYNIPDFAVRDGMRTVCWQARFEIVCRDPLIIADGGHNPEGIDSAVSSVKEYFGEQRVGVITGIMADKDYRYMADRIASVAQRVFCLTPDNPRALCAEKYAEVFGDNGTEAVACESVADAVSSAIAWAKENNAPVVSLGSLYMYGEVVGALKKRNK
jgi:dihydrofolate synthase/folylpolyglutamate synthase